MDIAKVFPSVSYQALLAAFRAFGIPRGAFLSILDIYVYQTGFRVLQGQKLISAKIIPERGVRQGDLSSPIFDILPHRILEALPSEIGIQIADLTTNAFALVDDINLHCKTNLYTKKSHCLQTPINKMVDFLKSYRMSINIDKRFAL